MKQFINNTLLVVLSITCVLLISTRLFAGSLITGQFNKEQPSAPSQEKAVSTPDLADIIPLASLLPGRLAQLKDDINGLLDISKVENKFSEYRKRVDGYGALLDEIQGAGGYSVARLTNLSRRLRDEKTFFDFVNRPLARDIRKVAGWKTDWVEAKKRWNDWENNLRADDEPEQLKSAFTKAHVSIDAALNILQRQLETMLRVQADGAAVTAKIDTLVSKTAALISENHTDSLLTASPPMFSQEYFAQFRSELWQKALTNLKMLTLPDSLFFVRHGWAIIAQILVFFIVILTIYRNKQTLFDTKQWKFLAERPIASGVFVGLLTILLFPQIQVFPTVFQLVILVAGGVSFGLLLERILEPSWKRQAALGVTILFVVTGTASTINLPLPLHRIFTLLTSVAGLFFFWRWSRESAEKKETFLYRWLLKLGIILAVVIIGAQFWGKDKVAAYLFGATVTSLTITLAYILFMFMIHGVLKWVFYTSPVWNIKMLRSEAQTLVNRVGFIIYTCIVIFALLPMILSTWDLFSSVQDALNDILAFGFNIGSQRISIGLMIAAVGTLYISFLLSWTLPKVLLDEKVAGAGLERGVRISIGRLIQYFVVFIGFLLTIMVLGLDLTKITIILSALGVGIGFGLQGIVNNFISGLILLFVRPVRSGDTIEMGEVWAEVKRIGLQSTNVKTFDESEMIIPNANLVSNEVTNWTLSNRLARLKIPVGVAYGSDIPLVIETLLACTKELDQIVKSPEPQVLFLSFGESSLDFELRVWIMDVEKRWIVSSELHQKIDQKFREANIEIAFPQRDLHFRNIAAPIIVKSEDAD